MRRDRQTRYSKPQANLDFSEGTIKSQHNPTQNGQGELLPMAYGQQPTNANGTSANTDFSPETIANASNHTQFNSIGTGGTPSPFSEKLTLTKQTPDNSSFTEINKSREQFGTGMGFDNVPNIQPTPPPTPMSTPSPTNNLISSGGKIDVNQYTNIIEKQKLDRKTNVSLHGIGDLKRSNVSPQHTLSASDFFKGVKSGNNPIQIDTGIKQKDGTNAMMGGYGDVSPLNDDTFGDMGMNFMGDSPVSNEKKNKKALKDQFDLYSKIGNF
jgi:hypothetical protein